MSYKYLSRKESLLRMGSLCCTDDVGMVVGWERYAASNEMIRAIRRSGRGE